MTFGDVLRIVERPAILLMLAVVAVALAASIARALAERRKR